MLRTIYKLQLLRTSDFKIEERNKLTAGH